MDCKVGGAEKVECNNHETQKVESFKNFGSKMVTNRRVKEDIMEIMK
jgi:hypothetical protein